MTKGMQVGNTEKETLSHSTLHSNDKQLFCMKF